MKNMGKALWNDVIINAENKILPTMVSVRDRPEGTNDFWSISLVTDVSASSRTSDIIYRESSAHSA